LQVHIIILAYVDPGLGALVWQIILSACVGMFFYVQKSRRWIVGCVFKLLRPVKTKSDPTKKQ